MVAKFTCHVTAHFPVGGKALPTSRLRKPGRSSPSLLASAQRGSAAPAQQAGWGWEPLLSQPGPLSPPQELQGLAGGCPQPPLSPEG